jgi:cysteine-rich repeat protein
MHRISRLLSLATLLVTLGAASASAEPIRLSTTGTATLGSPPLTFARDDVVELQTTTGTAVKIFSNANFTNSEQLDAVHVLPNGRIILSTAAQATIAGLTFQDGDLVEFDPVSGTASLVFVESEHFTGNADIDAVHVMPDGTLILSTDATATIGNPPLTFRDGDLVRYDPATKAAALFFSEDRFAGDENIDGVHVLPNGHIVLSVARATGASLGGLTFRGGDLVEYDPATDTATLFLSQDVFGADRNIDAVSLGCGNGVVESDEACDAAGESAACNADCTLAACGDGVVNVTAGELCDDGNLADGDGCDSNCTPTGCGNGVVTAGEDCDDAGESATCDLDCTAAACGDGTLNPTAGELCDDGNTADGDCCSATCGFEPAQSPCPDDGDACTTTSECDGAGTCRQLAEPAAGCRTPVQPGKALFILRDRVPDEKDQLQWTWSKGQATDPTDFGDPTAADDYTLCVYDESGATPSVVLRALAPAGGVCGIGEPKPCWKPTKKGYRYVDKALTPDGLLKLDLRAGIDGKAKILAIGRGANLPMPVLPLATPLRVQLLAGNGQCWEAVYSAAGVRRNLPAEFKAKAD